MFRRVRRQQPEISLSALVDVLFILIIFVMLAAHFDNRRAIDVSLPGGGDPQTRDQGAAILLVPLTGPPRLQGQTVSEERLEAALRALRADRDSLILAADRVLPLERATHLLTVARRAGFASVAIDTSGDAASATAESGP